MPIRYNPAKGYKSPHRKLAEQIAKAKKIKVQSAMRYIQRAVAPIGKQRIQKPKFAGIKPKLKRVVQEHMQTFYRESFKKEIEKHVSRPLTYKAIYDYVSPQIERDFNEPVKLITRLHKRDLRGDFAEELAVFSNIFGIEEAADILGTDTENLINIFEGEPIGRRAVLRIESAFEDWKEDNKNVRSGKESLYSIESAGAVLRQMREAISSSPYNDIESADIFREALAKGKINIEFINQECAMIFSQLTNSQVKRIIDGAYDEDFEGAIDLNRMFTLFYADGKDVLARQGDFLKESVFWAWFRELFYPQTGD